MPLFSWLHKRLTGRPRTQRTPGRKPTPRFRPRLETLEARDVPSTLRVTNLNDIGPGSLRYEIAVANSGDTITFSKHLPAGIITLTNGELVINKSLTIQGPTAYSQRIVSEPWVTPGPGDFPPPNPGSRIFEVDGAGTTVALSGLTLAGGGGTRYGNGHVGNPYDGYGGAILNFGTLTLSACTLGGETVVDGLVGNNADYGGAIANFGTLSVTGCFVSQNSAPSAYFPLAPADGEGGGIYNAGALTLSGSDVDLNSAVYGGGIYNTAAGTATVSGCTLSSNVRGGGIYNAGTAAALTVLDSMFRSNSPANISGPYTDGGGNTFN
jgi:hypothetical protein